MAQAGQGGRSRGRRCQPSTAQSIPATVVAVRKRTKPRSAKEQNLCDSLRERQRQHDGAGLIRHLERASPPIGMAFRRAPTIRSRAVSRTCCLSALASSSSSPSSSNVFVPRKARASGSPLVSSGPRGLGLLATAVLLKCLTRIPSAFPPEGSVAKKEERHRVAAILNRNLPLLEKG